MITLLLHHHAARFLHCSLLREADLEWVMLNGALGYQKKKLLVLAHRSWWNTENCGVGFFWVVWTKKRESCLAIYRKEQGPPILVAYTSRSLKNSLYFTCWLEESEYSSLYFLTHFLIFWEHSFSWCLYFISRLTKLYFSQ